MRVIFASYNPGKLKEVGNVAKQHGIELSGISEAGVDIEFEETGDTFEDNAKLKLAQALNALPETGDTWVAADDSGMMIDALDGEPSVKTRRWAGYEMTDQEIMDMTLDKLKNVPETERTARFRTVVALGKLGVDPTTFKGELRGRILDKPDEESPTIPGFPAAQLFYIPKIEMTYGQYVSSPSKATDFPSHRAQAFNQTFRYFVYLANAE